MRGIVRFSPNADANREAIDRIHHVLAYQLTDTVIYSYAEFPHVLVEMKCDAGEVVSIRVRVENYPMQEVPLPFVFPPDVYGYGTLDPLDGFYELFWRLRDGSMDSAITMDIKTPLD